MNGLGLHIRYISSKLKIDNIDGIFSSLDFDSHLMRVPIAECPVVSG